MTQMLLLLEDANEIIHPDINYLVLGYSLCRRDDICIRAYQRGYYA